MNRFSLKTITLSAIVLSAVVVGLPLPTLAANKTVPLSQAISVARTTTKSSSELTKQGWFRGSQCLPAPLGTRPSGEKTTTYDPVTDIPVSTSDNRLVICPKVVANNLPRTDADAHWAATEMLIWMVNSIIVIIGNVGVMALGVASRFLGIFLSENRFVTHPLVGAGWSFLQGIANLGFVLGLLFIAGATALQLESYAWRKMLPKLLIAALLINFSLVIGAIIIDASRVLMAIEVRIMGGGTNIANLGVGILKNSPLLQGVFDAASGSLVSPGKHAWEITIRLFQAAAVIWIVAIGLLFVAVGIFARWIALVLLLIFSPLAYLAFALPNMQKYGERWWKEFLTWVFYGPILLFFILLISNVGYVIPLDNSNSWIAVTDTIILGVLLYAASKAGKAFAGTGGAAAMDFASKMGKKGANALYVGSGTQRVARNIRDVGTQVSQPIRKSLGIGEYSPYDKDGKLKKGETSVGNEIGKYIRKSKVGGKLIDGTAGAGAGVVIGGALAGPIGMAVGGAVGSALSGYFGSDKDVFVTPDQRTEANEARAVAGNVPAALLANNPALNASRLQQGHVLNALGPNKGAIDANVDIILGSGRASQAKAIAQNKSYLRKADATRLSEMEVAIRANGNMSPAEQEKAIEQIYKTLDEIKKE